MLFHTLCSVAVCAILGSLAGCGVVPPPYQYAFGTSPSDDRSELARFESFFQYTIYSEDQGSKETVRSATVFVPPGEYTLRIPTKNFVNKITTTDPTGWTVTLSESVCFTIRQSVVQGDRFYLIHEEKGDTETIIVYRIFPSGDRSEVKRVTMTPDLAKTADNPNLIRRE